MRAMIFLLAAAVALVASASAQTDIVINEIYYDGPGTDTGTFTELLGPPGTVLDNYMLVGINGSDGSEYRTIYLDGMVIPDDGYLVIAQDETVPEADYIDPGVDWQNGPDEVELRYDDGGESIIVVDGICYGYSENLQCEGGTNGPDVSSGNSISRCPDGQDTDDNEADTAETIPTPGGPNDCGGGPVEMSLCEAIELDADGFPIHYGELVHITGTMIVLNNHGTFSADHLDHAATDGECCVYLFDFDEDPDINEGDEIDVTGTISFYRGKVEISGPGLVIEVVSTGNPLPEPQEITTEELATNGNDYESCFISICGLYIVGGDPWPEEGQNANIEVVDATEVPVTLRIDRDTDIDGSPAPEEPFTCLGIAGQYDPESPYTEGFQLLPRKLEDVHSGEGCETPVEETSWSSIKALYK